MSDTDSTYRNRERYLWTERGKEIDFIDKLIHGNVANITVLMDHVVCMLLYKAKAVHLKTFRFSD
jgi:hypothetical protein